MKAITLTQPWASLVMLRFKQIETRSWDTKYRGPLAIHAGKTMPCRIGQRLDVGEFEVERDRAGLLLRGPIGWLIRKVDFERYYIEPIHAASGVVSDA